MTIESNDPVVHEYPVYLNANLAESLYLLQFPIQPVTTASTSEQMTALRFKEKAKRLYIEQQLDTSFHTPRRLQNASTNMYSREDHDQEKARAAEKHHYNYEQGQRFHIPPTSSEAGPPPARQADSVMDKMTWYGEEVHGIGGTESSVGVRTGGNYMLAVRTEDGLHLTQLKALLQMRPTLEHVEEAAKLDRRINGRQNEEMAESEVEESHAEDNAAAAPPTKAVSITRRFEKRTEGAINSNREVEQRTKREEARLADEEAWLSLAPQSTDSLDTEEQFDRLVDGPMGSIAFEPSASRYLDQLTGFKIS